MAVGSVGAPVSTGTTTATEEADTSTEELDLFSAESLNALTGSFRDRFGSSLFGESDRRLQQYTESDMQSKISSNMRIAEQINMRIKSDVDETKGGRPKLNLQFLTGEASSPMDSMGPPPSPGK